MSAPRLRRCLSAWDLTFMGIGQMIGAGIFVLTGVAAATQAGPAIILSFVVAGIACVFVALSYAELAASVGGCGGAYGYAYALFGELIGLDRRLDHRVGGRLLGGGRGQWLVGLCRQCVGPIRHRLAGLFDQRPCRGRRDQPPGRVHRLGADDGVGRGREAERQTEHDDCGRKIIGHSTVHRHCAVSHQGRFVAAVPAVRLVHAHGGRKDRRAFWRARQSSFSPISASRMFPSLPRKRRIPSAMFPSAPWRPSSPAPCSISPFRGF